MPGRSGSPPLSHVAPVSHGAASRQCHFREICALDQPFGQIRAFVCAMLQAAGKGKAARSMELLYGWQRRSLTEHMCFSTKKCPLEELNLTWN
jgi:hypothetical protein